MTIWLGRGKASWGVLDPGDRGRAIMSGSFLTGKPRPVAGSFKGRVFYADTSFSEGGKVAAKALPSWRLLLTVISPP